MRLVVLQPVDCLRHLTEGDPCVTKRRDDACRSQWRTRASPEGAQHDREFADKAIEPRCQRCHGDDPEGPKKTGMLFGRKPSSMQVWRRSRESREEQGACAAVVASAVPSR
jgi:hypothetical protein